MERDLRRGARIRELREPIPQPRIAEAVGVSLRAYQAWEAGGGITWENVLKLARVLGSSSEYIMRGDEQPAEPPADGQLDRIERKLEEILSVLADQRLATEYMSTLQEAARLADEQFAPRAQPARSAGRRRQAS